MQSRFLYHYTTLDSLKMIISNKTIKFRNLSDMDDPDEGVVKDFKRLRQFIYTSSWTDDFLESLPLWESYSKNMTGVRIGLPEYPFVYNSDNQVLELEEIAKKSDIPIVFPGNKVELFPVTYTKDSEILKNLKVHFKHPAYPEGEAVSPQLIGRFKNSFWEFQREWRYRIVSYPFMGTERPKHVKPAKEYTGDLVSWIDESEGLDELFLTINQTAFENMEVLCGPRMSEEDKIEIEKMMKTNGIKTKLQTSEVNVRQFDKV